MEKLKDTCFKCGSVDYVTLSFAGPHIKSSCSHCGAYNKFIDKSIIPDAKTIKMKIMVLADSNIELIKSEKEKLGIFYKGISGMYEKLAYYQLFKAVKKAVDK